MSAADLARLLGVRLTLAKHFSVSADFTGCISPLVNNARNDSPECLTPA
jgi:hypothetical protein